MKTYRELAQAAALKGDRQTWYRRRLTKARLAELIDGSFDNYAGEQAELIRGYCLYLAPRRSPNKSSPTPDGSAIWIVMKWQPDGNHEFQGVFGSEARAVAACRTNLHCVCPATVGVELGQATETWPGAWYPLCRSRPQNGGLDRHPSRKAAE